MKRVLGLILAGMMSLGSSAVDKGLDVDMPRNLAKSVTVE